MIPEYPNLFIVGAPKCGTTALYHYLAAHPDVFMSSVKEPHHFATTEPRSRFADPDRYAKLFKGSCGYPLRGEASTSYLFDEHAATRIHEHTDDARILALVRDPVQRAYSHWLMDTRDGTQDLPFTDALVHDEHCGSSAWGGPSHLYVELGMYGEQIRRYLDTIGPSRMLVVESSDLLHAREQTLARVLTFLGLPSYAGTTSQQTVLDRPYNVNSVPTSSWSRFWGSKTNLYRSAVRATPPRLRPIARAVMMHRQPASHPPMSAEAQSILRDRLRSHVLETEAVVGRPLPSLHASLTA